MNRKRLTVLWVTVVIIVAMALVPPWKEINLGGRAGPGTPCGYAPLWGPPTRGIAWGVSLDWSRLILQWIVVVVIAGAAILSLGDRTKRAEPDATQ